MTNGIEMNCENCDRWDDQNREGNNCFEKCHCSVITLTVVVEIRVEMNTEM